MMANEFATCSVDVALQFLNIIKHSLEVLVKPRKV